MSSTADWFNRFAYNLARPGSAACYRSLLRNQYLGREELEALQLRKLQRLVRQAWDHVPYYRRRFSECGVRPQDIRCLNDLGLLPVLTREELRRNMREMVSRTTNPRRLKVSTTGGTTGIPVRTLMDNHFPRALLGWRMLSWWGFGPGVELGLLWRETRRTRFRRFLERMAAFPARHVRLDASAVTPAAMEAFIKACGRRRVPVLHGYTGAVHHLARYLEERGGPHWRPQLVWVTCAPLSLPHRRCLERVFQAPVLDQYGSCEVYWIAAQCPSSRPNLHIFADTRLVETVDDRGNPLPLGTPGEILVTDLENLAFPIIRYAIGDRGRRLRGSCGCGLGLPLMAPVMGKTVDTVFLPDGTAITDLNVLFDDFPEAVNAFQVHQEKTGRIEVRYVLPANAPASRTALDTVQRRLTAMTRGQLPIRLREVHSIPHMKGKLQYVFSEYRRPF